MTLAMIPDEAALDEDDVRHGIQIMFGGLPGLITIGSFIAVNSEIRVINSIISNTNLEVTSAFTITANLEEMIVVNTAYDAIATEITLDEIVAENELILTVEE